MRQKTEVFSDDETEDRWWDRRQKTHTDGNVILLTCARLLHLLLHLFLSLWVFGIASQLSTKLTSFLLFPYNPHSASWAWLRPGFVQKSQLPRLLSLTISLSLTPQGKLAGVGHWSAHFKQLEILNPLSPRQSQLIWISCDYCNSSYKTPDSK